MSQSKILLDSNAYFRLAQSIHPLLKVEFGEQRYCLYVINELQSEYDRNPRLKNTFYWVNETEYKKNRNCRLNISRKSREEILHAQDFIKDYAKYSYSGLSKVDITALAHAYVLNIPIVTDDSDMLDLAEEFNIKTLKTLELLKLMFDCRHIDITVVRRIASFWNYSNDKPKSFTSDYRKLFKEPPPR